MAVTEKLGGLGSWSIQLSAATPREILKKLDYFGHIAVHSGPVDPRVTGDALLASSRYTGVFRGKGLNAGNRTLRGPGMSFWLGDEEDKGDLIETPLAFVGASFDTIMTALLPPSGSVIEGTFFSLPGTHDFKFQYSSRRKAIEYVCATLGADYRVNGDGTMDAGLESDLFQTVPKAALSQRNSGVDMSLRSVDGDISTEQDMEDLTTRTVLLAAGQEAATVTATADMNPVSNVWKDIFGNPIKLTRIVSESDTDATNAPARAQLQLNRFSGSRDSITCGTEEYDLKGDVVVGDYLWVFAPDEGVYDLNNEIYFMGDRMYPMRLRLVEMIWPITAGMSVSFRRANGEWLDLTPYVIPESGQSNLVVGGYNRSLIAGADGGPAGTRPIADTSIPGVPVWVQPFRDSVYQSLDGANRTQVELEWTRPENIDGTTILDGDRYDIRYRNSAYPIFPVTHAQMEAFTHAQLEAGTHEMPIVYTPGEWQYTSVPFDVLKVMLSDLPTNMPYEAQVRAVDSAKPANTGEWSVSAVFQTAADTLPPAVPAPPDIAASTLAVQMTHNLGRSDGGSYNLDADLHHLELHGEYTPLFTPNLSTLLGKFSATYGMMLSQTPVVGTAQIDSVSPVYFKVIAVDANGNASEPSTAVQATALLVDDAHISNLTVSKVTAGTISATWLVGGTIISGTPGAGRVQMVPGGFEAYNPTNVRTVLIDINGDVSITGKLNTGLSGPRVIVDPQMTNGIGGTFPAVAWYDNATVPTYVRASAQADEFMMAARHTGTHLTEGGFIRWNLVSGGTSGSAYLGFLSTISGAYAYYQVGSDGGHHLRGFHAKVDNMGGVGLQHVDQVGGSGTSMTYGYGATYLSTPMPFVSIQPTSGGAAGKYVCVSARSATGFTVEYPAGNCDIMIWAVRYG